jgi:chromosome segregation ATPase
MITDTPRTDAVIQSPNSFFMVRVENLCRELERELTQIRNALGDKGQRTHKELIQLATKAAEWRTWKEKYTSLRNAHIAEGQDPAGTIWEHADKLQRELAASKAEVERLKEQLESTQNLCLKFWSVLEEHGFELEINQ